MFAFNKIIRGFPQIAPNHQGCVVTIGNFDGVHQGHQTILRQTRERAKEIGVPSMVMIFEPQTREFFHPTEPPLRITPLRDKVCWLSHYGIDYILCAKFDEQLSTYSAEQFIQELLIKKLQIKHLIIGDDFKFGNDRRGDFALLKQMGEKAKFGVEHTLTVDYGSERVSSSRIRAALTTANFRDAKAMLGHPYYLSGHVIPGQKLGRELGVATANIAIKEQLIPCRGVFVVKVILVSGESYKGVANLGTRPTVGGKKTLLEVHLFDFAGDLYRKRLYIELMHRIREERHFESLASLKKQIEQDIVMAKSFF